MFEWDMPFLRNVPNICKLKTWKVPVIPFVTGGYCTFYQHARTDTITLINYSTIYI